VSVAMCGGVARARVVARHFTPMPLSASEVIWRATLKERIPRNHVRRQRQKSERVACESTPRAVRVCKESCCTRAAQLAAARVLPRAYAIRQRLRINRKLAQRRGSRSRKRLKRRAVLQARCAAARMAAAIERVPPVEGG